MCKARSSRAPMAVTDAYFYSYVFESVFESVLASACGTVYEFIHRSVYGSVCRSVFDNFMVLSDKSFPPTKLS